MSAARPRVPVSVILPAVNEEKTIARAISTLLDDPLAPRLEILIAVGPSTDRTRDAVLAIAARDPRVRLIDNPAKSIPAGLNAAIRASRGDIIIRMDGHAEPDPGYVSACLAALRVSGAWNVGGQMRKIGHTTAAKAASAATSSPFGIGGGRRFHLLTQPQEVDSVWLGCWPRWVFERIGLFDPEMVQNQDDELNQRITDAGGLIYFDPSIAAGYLSRATWSGLTRQYYRYGLYKIRGLQKRPQLLRLRHIVPAAVVAAGAALLVLSLFDLRALALLLLGSAAWLSASYYFGRRVAGAYASTPWSVVAAYACIHLGYGVGTWAGLARFAPRWVIDRRGTVPRLTPLRDSSVERVVDELDAGGVSSE